MFLIVTRNPARFKRPVRNNYKLLSAIRRKLVFFIVKMDLILKKKGNDING